MHILVEWRQDYMFTLLSFSSVIINRLWLFVSQNLEFPWRSLVFIIQAISIEVQLPGSRLVFIIQAIRSGVEPQTRGSVALGGEGCGRLVEVTCDCVSIHWTKGRAGPRELVMHRSEIRTAVHPAEIRSRSSVALAISWCLCVSHRIWSLHAGRRGRERIR